MATAQVVTHNRDKAGAFVDRLLGILNDGALCLMTSLGHRSGLFDVMADLPPATSREIAAAAGLDERYVREWLGAMVVGGIVEYDPERLCYRLPAEHATSLTRGNPTENMAVFAQYIPVLAGVEERVLDSFRNGGGVPYDAFHRFHEVMAEDSGQSVVAALLDSILPLAPGLTRRLEEGIDVLDIGCGSGRALNLLARSFPNSRFVGYDFCQEPLRTAREEAERQGSRNLRFEQRDVARLGHQASFDLVTGFDVIHDQAAPDDVLAGVARALRPTGTFLMQDIAGSRHVERNLEHPLAAVLYTVSTMHCMTVSLAQDGAGLGTMWGEETAVEMLRAAGFARIDVKRLPHDVQNCYYVARKG